MIAYLRSSANMIYLIFSLKTSCLSKHACIYCERNLYNTLIKMKPLSLALQCGQDEYRWSSSWKRNYTLEDYHLATKGLESGLVLFSKKDSQEVTQQYVCVCLCVCTHVHVYTCTCAWARTHTCTWESCLCSKAPAALASYLSSVSSVHSRQFIVTSFSWPLMPSSCLQRHLHTHAHIYMHGYACLSKNQVFKKWQSNGLYVCVCEWVLMCGGTCACVYMHVEVRELLYASFLRCCSLWILTHGLLLD